MLAEHCPTTDHSCRSDGKGFKGSAGQRNYSRWGNSASAPTKKRLKPLEAHVAATGEVLTEAQVVALERKQDDDVAHGEIETAHPGYSVAHRLLSGCDAVFRIPGASTRADLEVAKAREMGLPIFTDLNEVPLVSDDD